MTARVAILSDVHGNLAALTAVRAALKKERPDHVVITGDHGNIEEMVSPTTGLPESQHDASPVPLYIIAPEFKGKKFANMDTMDIETLGSLADVAPTILEIMGIPKPPEMTGRSLLDNML